MKRHALAGLTSAALLITACGPQQQAQPTSPPAAAKPTEAPKPAATTAPATKPTEAAAAKPTEAAAAKPTEAAAAKPADTAKPKVELAPAPAGTPLPAPVAPNTLTSGTVAIDGSSTVFPVTEAMAEEFQRATNGRVRITVGISGTWGGFQKFCNNETDVSNASRPISLAEMERCKAANIGWMELPVAFDGLSVMTSPRNTFLDCLKRSELKKIWEPEAQGTIMRWNQVRPEFPDQPINLFGPGTDSGTFDYWTDVINGREKASRGDFTASEDDNVLVQGIANDPNSLGYFGFAYYEENRDRLKLLGVDNEMGAGCIKPSAETIADGTYQPLSRPIFIYPKISSLDKPEVREFVRFYVNPTNSELISQTGYIPFPQGLYERATQRLNAGSPGTVFTGGGSQGAKMEDLFTRPLLVLP
jgi:phosphate transport system substrate-binding protein